jgi:hypothetical protein
MEVMAMSKKFVRLSQGLSHYRLVPESEVESHISDIEKDYYTSIFLYDQSHYDTWKATKSLAGVKDVVTNRIVFDFDKAGDLEAARIDALKVINRLTNDDFNVNNIQVAFSGSKGFSVEIHLDKTLLSPTQFKNLVFSYAGDLPTFDTVVNDPNRIFRVTGTKHQKSGLYKFPLLVNQLKQLSVSDILKLAEDIDNAASTDFSGWVPVNLPPKAVAKINQAPQLKPTAPVLLEKKVSELDWSTKPKWLSNCKFAIMNGFVPEGQRSNSLMALASTFKSQGFSEEHTFSLLKTTTEKMSEVTGDDIFPEQQLRTTIVNQVYGLAWKGGTYTCKDEGWLKTYCYSLGKHKCEHHTKKVADNSPRTIMDVTPKFKNFVMNIDKNTIKTGIKTLDENLVLTTGMPIGIVGAPGSSKTTLALEILNNTSKMGISSCFASLDMTATRIYEKLAYRLTGKGRSDIYNMFKNDQENTYLETLEKEFGNVFFYDKSSPTVKDIRDYILSCEEQTGKKIKLVMVDYFERIFSDVNDDTAASKKVAAELQDMVNDLDICLITLLQPNKMSGDLSQPITSYQSIKGSSFLAQSLRMILGLYREGFDPTVPGQDRFVTINVLKNDLGEPNSFDFTFDGKRGRILEISEDEREALSEIRNKIREKKAAGIL